MAWLIQSATIVGALGELIDLAVNEGTHLRDRLELMSVLVSVGREENLQKAKRFCRTYQQIVGREYWRRAERLYLTTQPLRWKVSYRGRLTGQTAEGKADQLTSIVEVLIRRPGANTLSFAFYRPKDHSRARARPASMPCPIAGDFKYRNKSLVLNVFFRTHDIYRLGLPDLYFLRILQRETLRRARKSGDRRFRGAKEGEMNVFFSRAFLLKAHTLGARRLLLATKRAVGTSMSRQ